MLEVSRSLLVGFLFFHIVLRLRVRCCRISFIFEEGKESFGDQWSGYRSLMLRTVSRHDRSVSTISGSK